MKNIFTSRRLVIGVIVVIVAIGAITLGARAHNSEKEPSLPVRVISDVSGWTSNIVNAPIRAVKGGFDSVD